MVPVLPLLTTGCPRLPHPRRLGLSTHPHPLHRVPGGTLGPGVDPVVTVGGGGPVTLGTEPKTRENLTGTRPGSTLV